MGDQFCKKLELRANSITEVIKGLEANFPGFTRYLVNINLKVFRSTKKECEYLDEDTVQYPFGECEELILCPAIEGSGGFGRIIAGAALVAVGVFTGASFLVPLGASLALGGVAQLLSPKNQKPSGESERADSFLISQSSRTDYYGRIVPLLYGERIILNPPTISQSPQVDQLIPF